MTLVPSWQYSVIYTCRSALDLTAGNKFCVANKPMAGLLISNCLEKIINLSLAYPVSPCLPVAIRSPDPLKNGMHSHHIVDAFLVGYSRHRLVDVTLPSQC